MRGHWLGSEAVLHWLSCIGTFLGQLPIGLCQLSQFQLAVAQMWSCLGVMGWWVEFTMVKQHSSNTLGWQCCYMQKPVNHHLTYVATGCVHMRLQQIVE